MRLSTRRLHDGDRFAHRREAARQPKRIGLNLVPIPVSSGTEFGMATLAREGTAFGVDDDPALQCSGWGEVQIQMDDAPACERVPEILSISRRVQSDTSLEHEAIGRWIPEAKGVAWNASVVDVPRFGHDLGRRCKALKRLAEFGFRRVNRRRFRAKGALYQGIEVREIDKGGEGHGGSLRLMSERANGCDPSLGQRVRR